MTTFVASPPRRLATTVLAGGLALLGGFVAFQAAFWGMVTFTGCFISCGDADPLAGSLLLVGAVGLLGVAGGLAHVAITAAVLGHGDRAGTFAAAGASAALAGLIAAVLALVTDDLGLAAAAPLLAATALGAVLAARCFPRAARPRIAWATPLVLVLAGCVAALVTVAG